MKVDLNQLPPPPQIEGSGENNPRQYPAVEGLRREYVPPYSPEEMDEIDEMNSLNARISQVIFDHRLAELRAFFE